MKSRKVYGIVILLVLIHLIVVYTKSIFFLNPDKVSVWYDLPVAFLAGIGYAFITITNILLGKKKINNIVFSILDTAIIFIYYNGTNFTDSFILIQSALLSTVTGYGLLFRRYCAKSSKKVQK